MAELERLNKYLAHAGLGSRRHCEDLIVRGRVRINGQVVRELATKVDPDTQQVAVDGKALEVERLVYWLVNKPRGYLCTNYDPAGRALATDLVPHVTQRVYTVGRLDEDSEGLLLLTNDGDLAFRLMHPRFGVEKTYLVQVAGKPEREELQQLLNGVWLSDGHVKARRIRRLKSQGDSTWLEIVLAEGKNREVRRMLARLDHKVLRLKRVAIGPIQIGRLRTGKSRPVKGEELERLKGSTQRKPRREAGAGTEAAIPRVEGRGFPRQPRPFGPSTDRGSRKTRVAGAEERSPGSADRGFVPQPRPHSGPRPHGGGPRRKEQRQT